MPGIAGARATRASCASPRQDRHRDDARETGDVLADSILQTASMARCVSVAVTATHHTIFNPLVQARARGEGMFAAIRTRENS